ncbi:MAG: hypothetical protein COX17_01295 [Deltaproteobacteria bacterium CG23_combo_of_CG06-09_8_20_14_all_60_8]|nr:MAG: hypothetical protein AUK28_04515 [Desulfobacterales bacterium CG2_30_60_27]PIP44460.1 MAG: hypothetical protein COX17_01295 [Deltaproteobacteria bacterium CG23_combo_of_CG06-09_8_20_14_all_60_8]
MQSKPLTLLVALALVLCSGCSRDKKSEVYSTPQGQVTVTKQADGQQQQVTVQGKDGTSSLTIGSQIAPAALGVPFYPGTEQAEGGTWSMQGGQQGQAGSVTSAMLTSKDSLGEVLAFYKEKLAERKPEIYEMTMPTGKMANMVMEDGATSTTAIVITEDRDQGVTRIQITKSAK